MMNKVTLPLLVALLLLACSGKEDKPAAGGSAQSGTKANQTQKAGILQAKGIRPPEAVQLPDSNSHPSHDYSASPGNNLQTITIVNPNAGKLSPDDRLRLEQEKNKIETSIGDIVKEYDKNLDNPEKRQQLETEMREKSAGYKEKVLSLVKDQLKEEKPSQ